MNFNIREKVLFSGGFGDNSKFSAIAEIVEIRRNGFPVIRLLEVVPKVKTNATFQTTWEELHPFQEGERQLDIF